MPDSIAATVLFEFKAKIQIGAWDLVGAGNEEDTVDLSGSLLTVTGSTLSDTDLEAFAGAGQFSSQVSFTVDGFGTLVADAGDFDFLQYQSASLAMTGVQRAGFLFGEGPGILFNENIPGFFSDPDSLNDLGDFRFDDSLLNSMSLYMNSSNQFMFLNSLELTDLGDNVSIQTVPEPSTWALLVSGLLCAGICRFRKKVS